MSDEDKRFSFRFELKFLFCLILLLSAFLAGTQFSEEAWGLVDPEPLRNKLYGLACSLTGPTTAVVVLLLGRNITAVPMAVGILLCEIPFVVWVVGYWCELIDRVPPFTHMMIFAFLFGSVLSATSMLWQKVTFMRTLLGIPASFFLGLFLRSFFI